MSYRVGLLYLDTFPEAAVPFKNQTCSSEQHPGPSCWHICPKQMCLFCFCRRLFFDLDAKEGRGQGKESSCVLIL